MTTQARELAKLVNNSGDVNLGDDITLGSDGALLNFGADSDVVITHVADTGLLLNSSRQLQFGDSGTHIRQSADGVLQLTSDTEVEINATTIDINGNVDISGNLVLGGNITIGDADSDDISFGGELTSHIVPNADDTYDLGSSTKQWRNLYVDGTANLDVVDIDGAVDFASTTAHAGNASFADNAKAIFGAGSDLQIYHDGSNSIVQEVGTGDLRLAGNVVRIRNSADTENMISAVQDGAVTLCFDGNGKLATTSTGVTVTGVVAATSLDISGDVDVDGTLETDALSIASTTITATAAELNYTDGVTSNIQTQLDTKATTGKAIAMALVFG